jgi:hypothetical protein
MRGFHDLFRQKPPSCSYYWNRAQSQSLPDDTVHRRGRVVGKHWVIIVRTAILKLQEVINNSTSHYKVAEASEN